jgi:carbonic anhydrase
MVRKLARCAFALLLVVGPASLSCGSAPPAHNAPAASGHHAAWTYSGATAPDHWGKLDPAFAVCSRGTKQSPIDLPRTPAAATAPALPAPHWAPVPLSIVNNGHTVQVDDVAPSSLIVDGTSYSLAQFHFHTPSEHTIEGRSFDAELHLVHRAPGGELAVIAIFFARGAENPALRPFFDSLPMEMGEPHSVPGKTIDVAALLPRVPRFLSYDGSLTTPPCTEAVRWLVVAPEPAPGELAEADLAKLRAAMHAPNTRPPQAKSGRAVDLRAP